MIMSLYTLYTLYHTIPHYTSAVDDDDDLLPRRGRIPGVALGRGIVGASNVCASSTVCASISIVVPRSTRSTSSLCTFLSPTFSCIPVGAVDGREEPFDRAV